MQDWLFPKAALSANYGSAKPQSTVTTCRLDPRKPAQPVCGGVSDEFIRKYVGPVERARCRRLRIFPRRSNPRRR